MEKKQRARAIQAYFLAHKQQILADLETMVKAQSPSNHKELLDRCGQVILGLFKERVGIDGVVHPQEKYGNHLSFGYGEGDQQVLIVGHFDTVWEPDTIPYVVTEDKIYGPGVFDMKSGILQVIWAFKACRDLGIPLHKNFAVVCNADEEIGSPSSKDLISQLALQSVSAIVCEPSSDGAIKSARKGQGKFFIDITGVASHSGADHEKGRSAIEEMAHQILYIHSLTNYETGTTLNVGVAKGGTRSNVVADSAHMEVDMRMVTMAEARRIVSLIEAIKPHRDGVSIKVETDLEKPPFERTEANMKLFDRLQALAGDLDMVMTHTLVGGCSDGNTIAALGIPTLDGMGAIGDGGHARHEHILVEESLKKAMLFTHYIADL